MAWWQLESGVPTEYLVANWTASSVVFGEASWPNRQIFFPLKNKIIGKKPSSTCTHLMALVPAVFVETFVVPSSSFEDRRWLGLCAGFSGYSIHGVFASVPGKQLLVQEPAEGCPLLLPPLWLLQEYQVIMGLAHAWVFLLVSPAEEELGAFP